MESKNNKKSSNSNENFKDSKQGNSNKFFFSMIKIFLSFIAFTAIFLILLFLGIIELNREFIPELISQLDTVQIVIVIISTLIVSSIAKFIGKTIREREVR